jgi:hypothetical protein
MPKERVAMRVMTVPAERQTGHAGSHSVANIPSTLSFMRRLIYCMLASVLVFSSTLAHVQSEEAPNPAPGPPQSQNPGTNTDLFIMFGSDFDRPGLLPRANYNIGIGHTFSWLKKDPIGDELTLSYTYENSGSHGFLHTDFGEHTETLGVMKNVALPGTKSVTGYTWIQGGITSYTGKSQIQNRFCSGVSMGAVIHMTYHSSIWLQESYTKVVTVPWYTTSSVGYTYSW